MGAQPTQWRSRAARQTLLRCWNVAEQTPSDRPLIALSAPAQGPIGGELQRLASEVPEILHSPDHERPLPDMAMNHRTSAVRALLAAGVPVDARGDMGGTALHWACWMGHADIVTLLLARGASLTVEDNQFHGTPGG